MAGADTGNIWRRGVAVALAALTLGAGCSGGGSDGPPSVAAKVEGTSISGDQVERLVVQYTEALKNSKGATLSGEAPKGPLPEKAARRYVLAFLIREVLLHKEAKDNGIDTAPDPTVEMSLESVAPQELAGSGWTRDSLQDSLVAATLSKRLGEKLFPQLAVSPTEVERHWEAVKANFQAGWEAKVHAAFFSSGDAATQFRETLAGGAAFEETANDFGATQAGSMGTVSSTSAQVSPQLLEVLSGLEPGRPGDPVAAAGGFIVFLVEERQDRPARELDEVRDEVVAAVQDQKRQRLFSDWLDRRLKKASVTVNEFYGAWNRKLLTVGDPKEA